MNTLLIKKHLALICIMMFSSFFYSISAQIKFQMPDSTQTLLQRLSKNQRDIEWAHMNLQMATSGSAMLRGWSMEECSFDVQRVRMYISGKINDKFSYDYRQTFNKYSSRKSPMDKLEGTLEVASISWQMNKRLNLTAGKMAVQFGGYEFYADPINIREYTDFSLTMPGYLTGVNLQYDFAPSQSFNFQVVNAQLGGMDEEFPQPLPEGMEESKFPMMATVNWDGRFMDDALQFRYSLSYAQQARHNNIFYFTIGNMFRKNGFFGYLDFMYSREDLDSKGYISSMVPADDGTPRTLRNVDYYTAIAHLSYDLSPHFTVYARGAFEVGNIFKSSQNLSSGVYRRVWNGQLSAEYKPMKDKGLVAYIHLFYKNTHNTNLARIHGAHSNNQQKVALGLAYTLPVF